MRDAFVLQKREERRAPGDAILHSSPPARGPLTSRILASWPISKEARNGARSWLQCVAAQWVTSSLSPLFLRGEGWGEGLLPQKRSKRSYAGTPPHPKFAVANFDSPRKRGEVKRERPGRECDAFRCRRAQAQRDRRRCASSFSIATRPRRENPLGAPAA